MMPFNDDSMLLDRLHITTDVPNFYLQNGHKALSETSINNLNTAAGAIAEDFVPQSLPKAAVMDSSGSALERFRTTLGLYVRSSEREATATISLHPRLQAVPAFERAVFWHEFAHHIWYNADTRMKAWQRSLGRFWHKVKNTNSFRVSIEFQEETGIDFATQEEIWARAMTYFFLDLFGDDVGRIDWHINLDDKAWSRQECDSWQQELEIMLRSAGFNLHS
jgi:hypothetical protein